MKQLVLAILLAGAAAPGAYVPSDAERARWTMSDMKSLATAIEAYASDNNAYPAADSIDGLISAIQPMYMRKAHAHDAWGRPFLYVPSADRQSYRLVSAGADGRTDRESWDKPGPLSTFEDDAVLTAGALTRPWPFL
jgi:type II secretory pathway pseudopilin PulG